MGIQFGNPGFFLVLLAIPFLILLFRTVINWKRSAIRKIGDPSLISQLIRGYSATGFLSKFILLLLGFTLIVLAIVSPMSSGKMEKVERKGVDVMIALDVSNSMLAEDIRPNRLERAKQLVNGLIKALENDRVGLVLFAGRAYMQMPLTTDHAAAGMYVQN